MAGSARKPKDSTRFKDDEVREYRERGLLTDRQFATIERTARYLARNHHRVVAAALAELASLSNGLRDG